jgi:hypothetical protein
VRLKKQVNNINFVLNGLQEDKNYKIIFENATCNRQIEILEVSQGNISGKYIYVSKTKELRGKIDLKFFEQDSSRSVISVYANIYEKVENEFKLVDIAAFAFQIESESINQGGSKIAVYPPFSTEK